MTDPIALRPAWRRLPSRSAAAVARRIAGAIPGRLRRRAVFLLLLGGLAMMPASDATAVERPQRLFISGHSLTDRPVPDMLAALLAAAGRPAEWQRQHIPGSTIRERSEGREGSPAGSGFAAGVDKEGAPLDVRAALAASPPYDVLIITERHKVLEVMAYDGFARNLAGFVHLFLASNPQGASYFYSPWAGIGSREDPSRWIAFEQAADPVWRCGVAGVNAALGTGGRIGFIPAASALADLVHRLIAAPAAAGFPRAGPADIVAALFTDDVHLTDLGNYFVALLTYGVVFDGDVRAAPSWPGLDPARAAALRTIAADAAAAARQETVPSDCKGMPQRFIPAYTAYMDYAYGSKLPILSYLARRRAAAALEAGLGE